MKCYPLLKLISLHFSILLYFLAFVFPFVLNYHPDVCLIQSVVGFNSDYCKEGKFFSSFLLLPFVSASLYSLPLFFSDHTASHPLPLRCRHLLSLPVNQLNLPKQQKTIQVSSCALCYLCLQIGVGSTKQRLNISPFQ